MSAVKVQSIESLKLLRAALCKFADAARCVLSDADGELQRALNWLETEAVSRWQMEIRKRQEAVTKARDALRAKKLFRADGSKASVVDEEKALRLALARLEEAERKLVVVKRYKTILHKEVMQYRGQVQRFGNAVSIDIPIAVGRIEALVRHLEQYVRVKAAGGEVEVDSRPVLEGSSMRRAEDEAKERESDGEQGAGAEQSNEGVDGREDDHGRI